MDLAKYFKIFHLTEISGSSTIFQLSIIPPKALKRRNFPEGKSKGKTVAKFVTRSRFLSI